MTTSIFLNLPVKDLDKSKAFFEHLGFSFDPRFTHGRAACLVLGENLFAMLLQEAFFKTFTNRDICGDGCAEVLIALDARSREEVDGIVAKAEEAGGAAAMPPQDHGWMYGRGFADPDGHQWEIVFMDMAAMPQRP